MEAAVPWSRLVERLAPLYPKGIYIHYYPSRSAERQKLSKPRFSIARHAAVYFAPDIVPRRSKGGLAGSAGTGEHISNNPAGRAACSDKEFHKHIRLFCRMNCATVRRPHVDNAAHDARASIFRTVGSTGLDVPGMWWSLLPPHGAGSSIASFLRR